jgi:hypothetical protein
MSTWSMLLSWCRGSVEGAAEGDAGGWGRSTVRNNLRFKLPLLENHTYILGPFFICTGYFGPRYK